MHEVYIYEKYSAETHSLKRFSEFIFQVDYTSECSDWNIHLTSEIIMW